MNADKGFKQPTMESLEVQVLQHTKLMRAQQVSTIEQLYEYMTEHILVLHDPPGDKEMASTFINAMKDEKMRVQLAWKKPANLEAYESVYEAGVSMMPMKVSWEAVACFHQYHQIVALHPAQPGLPGSHLDLPSGTHHLRNE
jgi:hypothetical protein